MRRSNNYEATGGAVPPLTTATLDLDQRLLCHDYNLSRIQDACEKYGSENIYAEWIRAECLVIFGSLIPDISTDELIEEFHIELLATTSPALAAVASRRWNMPTAAPAKHTDNPSSHHPALLHRSRSLPSSEGVRLEVRLSRLLSGENTLFRPSDRPSLNEGEKTPTPLDPIH